MFVFTNKPHYGVARDIGVVTRWRCSVRTEGELPPERGTQHQSAGTHGGRAPTREGNSAPIRGKATFQVEREGKETGPGKGAKGKQSQFPARRAPTTGESRQAMVVV